GAPRTAELAAVPGVASVESATFIFAGLERPDGSDIDMIMFAGSLGPLGHVVSGRLADPNKPDEMLVSAFFLAANHAAIGDVFEMYAFTAAQAAQYGFNSPDPPAFLERATIVGAYESPSNFDDPRSIALVPAAAIAGRDVGVSATLMSVRTRPGVDFAELRMQLDALASNGPLDLEPVETISTATRTAVDAQARGLWILTLAVGIAAVVALGQLITRQSRVDDAERPRLVALGLRDGQLAIEAVSRAAIPVLGGVVLGGLLAPLVSGLFPTGLAGRIEPHAGFRAEVGTLIVCGAILTLALLVWSALALAVRPSTSVGRASVGAVDALAKRCWSATAATGLRLAFTRRSRDSGSVRAAVLGLTAIIAGLVGSLTFSASLDRLVGEPARYGQAFDALLGNGGSGETTLSDDERHLLEDEDIGAATLYGSTQLRVGSSTLRVVGFDALKGALLPTIVSGRLPAADDEIALGRLTARSLRVHVGSLVAVESTGVSRNLRITGLAVIPSIGAANGVGHDGVVTASGLAELDPSAGLTTALAQVRAGAPPGTKERLAEQYGLPIGAGETPAELANVARVRSVPLLLAAVLAGLALLTLAHLLLASIRNRRRDLAILSALGADRRWLARALHWQATSFVLLPALLGLPIGLVAGRLAFRVFADDMGVVDDAVAPFVVATLLLVALVVLANAVAPMARRGRRPLPAHMLRTE
ncbi:MAG: putative transport system permease protein, partial [Acidimicrobiaceae bacterium]|nr:putative transport system permease protein [Acidimicrobiaceae bacterium]